MYMKEEKKQDKQEVECERREKMKVAQEKKNPKVN